MKNITFHPNDLKDIGAYMGIKTTSGVRMINYGKSYGEDQDIKKCQISDVIWVKEVNSVAIVFDDEVILEDTCESIGNLCIVIKPDDLEKVLKPI